MLLNLYEKFQHLLSKIRDLGFTNDDIDIYSLITCNKMYLTTVSDIIFQTDNNLSQYDILLLAHKKYALYILNQDKFISSILKNGHYVTNNEPYWLEGNICPDYFIQLNFDGQFLSARPHSENYIVSLRPWQQKFETFQICEIDSDISASHTSHKLIFDYISSLSQAINKLTYNNLKLSNELNKLRSSHTKTINRVYKSIDNPKFDRALQDWYFTSTGKLLNLDHPLTFNEKIQWIKLNRTDSWMSQLTDKIQVRSILAANNLSHILIPCHGIYNFPEEIDFSALPEKYVIKCNHGCGFNIIINNNINVNRQSIVNKLNHFLNTNYAYFSYELQYLNIKPRIYIESYLENEDNDLYDYKLWCFHGKVYYIMFLSERRKSGLKMAFYDRDWNKQNFTYNYPLDKKIIPRPNNLDKMIEIAETLSKGFEHVRVDLYRMNDGKLYFGEMTFTSATGLCAWSSEDINIKFGKLIHLPTDLRKTITMDNAQNLANI